MRDGGLDDAVHRGTFEPVEKMSCFGLEPLGAGPCETHVGGRDFVGVFAVARRP